MEFNEYQAKALESAIYPNKGNNPHYPLMGLCGEVGEIAEKIKKLWRDQHKTRGSQFSVADMEAITKELGDVLWYVAALASEMRVSLDTVAELNLEKLASRLERGKLQGSGDER